MNLYSLAPLRLPWKAQCLDLRKSMGHSIHSPVRTYSFLFKKELDESVNIMSVGVCGPTINGLL